MPKNTEQISNLIDNNVNNDIDAEEEEDEEEDEDFNPENVEHSGGSEDEDEVDIEYKDDKKDTLEKIDEEKVSSLWKDFCKDVSSKDTKSNDTKPNNTTTAEEKKVTTVIKEYDFAGEIVVVKEQVSVDNNNDSFSKTSNNGDNSKETEKPTVATTSARAAPIKRNSGGLSSLLGQLSKKPKMSTLTKSLHDWTDYKKNQQLEEELDQHRKSKGSFIDRQAFLSRTDLREFEREKALRDHERRLRNQKPE